MTIRSKDKKFHKYEGKSKSRVKYKESVQCWQSSCFKLPPYVVTVLGSPMLKDPPPGQQEVSIMQLNLVFLLLYQIENHFKLKPKFSSPKNVSFDFNL